MEREKRDAIKLAVRSDRLQNKMMGNSLTIFGSSLREATLYASDPTVLGGFEHDLPIVVFRCVKELCRHGYQHAGGTIDRTRLLVLISEFDSEPHFGSTMPLGAQDLREIYALLNTYIFALPDPIIGSDMFEALWSWCVLPSLRSTDFLAEENKPRSFVPSDADIYIAEILLRLLPLPNLSLVVYLMGFFQRLPHLVSEEVGRAMLAGTCAKTSDVADGRAERAETMLRWLLARWDLLFNALFPAFDLQESIREQATPCPRRRSILVPPRVHDDSASDASSISSACALEKRLDEFATELDRELQLSTKRRNRTVVCNSPRPMSEAASYFVCDTPKLVPPEELPSPHSDVYDDDDDDEPELTYQQALRRISALERELDRNDAVVADAINETFKAREQVKELEAKLKGAGRPPMLALELDVGRESERRAMEDWHAVLHSDTEALKRQLAEVQRERDAALQLVDQIKGLMGPRAREF